MGKSATPSLSITPALFGAVQAAVLALLFGQPDARFQTSDIIRRVASGSGAVQRQLAALLAADLVTVSRIGNQKHYQANRNSPLFSDLHGLVLKTVAFAGPLRDALMTLRREIAIAFVFGSVASGTARASSDLDVMVVKRDDSQLDLATLYEALQQAESVLQRRIEPVLMTQLDWSAKSRLTGSFAFRVAAGPKLMLIGEESGIASS